MEPQILPQELIIEILLKLPVKSLVRFKCVCKSWLSLISDPHFGKSHFELVASSTQRLLLSAEHGPETEIVSVDFNAPSLNDDSVFCAMKLNFPLPQSNYRVRIVGCCRGFILLELNPYLYIWNPCTGFHIQLPPSPILSNFSTFSTVLVGFGYVASTDDYLVILGSCDEEDDGETRAEVFSSRANTWQELKSTNLFFISKAVGLSTDVGLHFNGTIYWLGIYFDVYEKTIVAFDLAERVFYEIAVPDDFDCFIDDCQLRVIEGYLSICAPGHDPGTDEMIAGGIWVMDEYEMQSSWSRVDVIMPLANFSPFCFTKIGDTVGIDDSALVILNDKGDEVDYFCYSEHREGRCIGYDLDTRVFMHTESLLSLPRNG